jgi:hypothetical protein
MSRAVFALLPAQAIRPWQTQRRTWNKQEGTILMVKKIKSVLDPSAHSTDRTAQTPKKTKNQIRKTKKNQKNPLHYGC